MPFTASFFHEFNPFKKPHLTHFLRRRQPRKEPIKVLVTDATGQVGSALVYMIARGLMFGEDQPVILHMLDIAEAKKAPDAEAKKGADAAAKKAPDAEAKERADAQAKEGADAEAKKAAKKRAQYVKAKKAQAAEAKKDPDAEAKKGAVAEDQKGVKMELLHQPLPLLQGVVLTCNVDEACAGVKVAVMLAGFPLEDNMDKREFLAKNAYMYKDQAAALQKHAAPNCKVLVVADPANTNALILKHLAPKIPANNITCLTRLPYKIVMTGLAERIEVHVTDVKNVIIWGNTSSNNLHLDFNHATATTNDGEKPVQHLVDHKLLNKEFITDVRKGCAEIFDPKKPTSVLFVASAICDHMSDWINGTPKGRWVSMGVYSDGNSYEVPKDIFYSFPVTCENGEWKIVQDLHICNCARKKMVTAADELVEERDEALKYAGSNVNVFNRFKVLTDCFPMKKPVKVLVTGAAGQVAYALVPLIARGLMLGQDQPVKLHMLCSAEDVDALNDVKMELLDIDALPLLQDVVATCNVEEAFDGVAIAIMLDGFIPKEGMAKKYVIAENVSIYKGHAAALEKHAAENCKVVVVANPANTNALVLKRLAPKIPPKNITCLTRLEHNRALAQIARGLHVDAVHVKNVIIWGNQSSTLYPDVDYAKVTTLNGDKWIIDFVTDAWLEREFMTNIVGQRDAEIMEARKQSNAALSAVTAVCDHMRDWILGTPEGTWVSMGVYSDGESYDAPSDVYCSFPVTCKNEEWTIVRDLTISKFSRDKMVATALELVEERDLALASIGAK